MSQNKFCGHLEDNPVYDLCGNGRKSSHHAVVVCPQARTLREAMRQHWLLPDELQFRYTGTNAQRNTETTSYSNCGGPGTCIIILLLMQELYVCRGLGGFSSKLLGKLIMTLRCVPEFWLERQAASIIELRPCSPKASTSPSWRDMESTTARLDQN